MRAATAANPECPAGILGRLSADKHHDVRAAAARNPECTTVLLARLAEDTHHDVRTAVTANPQSPLVLLTRLSSDNHPAVAASARSRIPQHQDPANDDSIISASSVDEIGDIDALFEIVAPGEDRQQRQ